VNPLSASCFNNFDNQPNRPPILVAVNIPRIKDGKMELAVLLGRLGAVAVCWSVGEFRFCGIVSSLYAGLQQVRGNSPAVGLLLTALLS